MPPVPFGPGKSHVFWDSFGRPLSQHTPSTSGGKCLLQKGIWRMTTVQKCTRGSRYAKWASVGLQISLHDWAQPLKDTNST